MSGYSISPLWKVLFADLGLNAENVLRRAALPGDLFARTRATLTSAEFYALWRGMEQESGDPLLPLRIGESISVESFDPPIFAALCSPDLDTALRRLALYKRLCGAVRLEVESDSSTTSMTLESLDKTVAAPASLRWMELVFFTKIGRIGTRSRVEPLRVETPKPPPQREDYAAFFGVPVTEGSQTRLLFSHADATRPFLTANEKMWEFFEPELKRRLSQLTEEATTADRVHGALLEMLPSGSASMDAVSRRLGTSTRTLQRRLQREGLSFQRVLDRTRESLARHYLRTSKLTGAEISFLLGFEDPNSFFRAFNAWTGMTPEQVRGSRAC